MLTIRLALSGARPSKSSSRFLLAKEKHFFLFKRVKKKVLLHKKARVLIEPKHLRKSRKLLLHKFLKSTGKQGRFSEKCFTGFVWLDTNSGDF